MGLMFSRRRNEEKKTHEANKAKAHEANHKRALAGAKTEIATKPEKKAEKDGADLNRAK